MGVMWILVRHRIPAFQVPLSQMHLESNDATGISRRLLTVLEHRAVGRAHPDLVVGSAAVYHRSDSLDNSTELGEAEPQSLQRASVEMLYP